MTVKMQIWRGKLIKDIRRYQANNILSFTDINWDDHRDWGIAKIDDIHFFFAKMYLVMSLCFLRKN